MAVIKLRKLRELGGEDLKKKKSELELEVARELGSIKTTGRPGNAGKYREMRKVIARINTLLRDRELKGKSPEKAVEKQAAAKIA